MKTYALFPIALLALALGSFGLLDKATAEQDSTWNIAAFGDVSTFVSTIYGRDNVSKTSSYAYLDFPEDVVIDTRNSDMYIADTFNNSIRRITGGNITTFAGNGHYGDINGPRTSAQLAQPRGIDISDQGIVVIADTWNNKIKKVHEGTVSTIASDLNKPQGVVISGSTVYISDTDNNAIKKVSINGGTVSTLAQGNHINSPRKMTLSSNGSLLYVAAAGSHKVVAVNTNTGSQTVIAGSGQNKYEEGTGTGASFQTVWGVDREGNTLYVTDGNGFSDRVRKIDLATNVTSLVADDTTMSSLNFPAGIDVYNGNIYVANQGIGTIRQFPIANPGNDSTYVGSDRFGNNNGTGTSSANVGRPYDIARARNDSSYLYLAENNKISEIHVPTATRTAIWGNSIDNYKEDTGSTGRASTISSLAVSSDRKTVFFTDTWNNRIRKVDIASRTSSLISGSGNINTTGSGNGYTEGSKTTAKFDNPRGIAISNDNQWLFISDTSNNRIRKVRVSDGQTFFIAGQAAAGNTNGTGSTARFNRPMGLAIDDTNTYLYLADSMSHDIRRIRISDGAVETFAGASRIGYRDGQGTNAVFAIPEYVTFNDGKLYVSEVGGHKVRRIDIDTRQVTTVAGVSGARGFANGSMEQAKFNDPKGMTVIGSSLYLADSWNDLIRKIELTATTNRDLPAPGASFFTYDERLRGGFYSTTCNLMGDDRAEIITGTGTGFGPQIAVFHPSGDPIARFFAYASFLRSGVRVACGDVNGDGRNEIVTAAGPGGRPHIRILNAQGQPVAPGFFALDGKFMGGANVAVGDIDGNGKAEIIVAASAGGGPHVTVHTYLGALKGNFMAYATTFRNGIRVAVGDFDGNGVDEIITGPETGSPHIQSFTGKGHRINPGFYAYDPNFKGGVSVAGGDVNGDGRADIIVGEGTTNQPHQSTVKMFTHKGVEVFPYFKAYAPEFYGGVNVSSGDTDGDGKDEVLVMPMSQGGPNVRIINPDEL
jgi:sugar lactone lactonase YvrE